MTDDSLDALLERRMQDPEFAELYQRAERISRLRAAGRCGHQYTWSKGWPCERRGWLFGRCVEHFLEQHRYELEQGRIGGRGWSLHLDFSHLNRPYVMVDDEWPRRWIALSYGNTNSDPVCSIEIHYRKDDRE